MRSLCWPARMASIVGPSSRRMSMASLFSGWRRLCARAISTKCRRCYERDDILKSTPLGWACRWGRIELVKLLLERGADSVEADAEPWATPRAWAERMGTDDLLSMLSE